MTTTIIACSFCGQKNRVPDTVVAGFVARCGKCKHVFNDDPRDDVDDDDDDSSDDDSMDDDDY
jgi:hypothetical protein